MDPSGHVSSWLRFDRPDRSSSPVELYSSRAGSNSRPSPDPHAGGFPRLPDTLRGMYEEYCEHEARELLTLISREAFRELYRQARRSAQGGDPELQSALDRGGPMRLASCFARRRLPLPPYDVWVRSYVMNRKAFLERLGIEAAPASEEPVTVSVRPIGDGWYGALRVNRSAEGWSGSIRFHRDQNDPTWTTGAVFRGEDVSDVRARFESFDDNTLRAFLRSILP